ncbi:MAG TPA: hypothetical protein VNE41_01410 [Chitinophagaceae bacterium]|nr:hypothetical protein [Chitinophagaceae bacterium]
MQKLKNILIALLTLLVILFAALYRDELHRKDQLSAKNRQLVTDYNNIQQQKEQLNKGYQQLLSHQDYVNQGQTNYVDEGQYYRENWKNFIHISASNYKTGFLGGIHGLDIIVSNQTGFTLDNVQVDIQYRTKGGGIFKTETVNISEVSPLSSKTAGAPDSRRGMSIQLQVRRITSEEMNFCYTDHKLGTGDKDNPYPCVVKGK